MRHVPVFLVAALAVATSASAQVDGSSQSAEAFVLESATFGSNTTLATAQVYDKGECNGGNTSPELHWKGTPQGTQSFAITMFDPDARGGSGWWHWILFDIDPRTTSLESGTGDGTRNPAGSINGRNSFGDSGYSGPCPPRDDKPHRYVFTIYALKTAHLGLPAGATGAQVKSVLEANTIVATTLQGQYER
jgi:Raf kinase inhibitor-like YbhB/YbcL family protein